jgi:hypothetical protein
LLAHAGAGRGEHRRSLRLREAQLKHNTSF